MEQEKSHEMDVPSAEQDADLAGTAESAVAPPRAPRSERVTRALASEGAAESEMTPQVEKSAWLRDDDYWRTVTFMAATGKRPSIQLPSRPLPVPDRFRPSSPTRSMAVLALVVALIILIPLGVVVAGDIASAYITLPAKIPGISLPTITPANSGTLTPTVAPTATPKKKK